MRNVGRCLAGILGKRKVILNIHVLLEIATAVIGTLMGAL